MLIVVLSPDPEQGLAALAALRSTVPCLLAVGPADEPKLILRAMREGAAYYVDEAALADGDQVDTNALGALSALGRREPRAESREHEKRANDFLHKRTSFPSSALL